MAAESCSAVKLSTSVYRVCLSHALMTEREEVMGLLLGEVRGTDVCIWASMTLQRIDKRPDRCEISPEQLVKATEFAETVSNRLDRKTRVVGWYHSHPHITSSPSHVDLRTQLQYQGMDDSFVGLIFTVWDTDERHGCIRHELIAFRAKEDFCGTPRRIDLRIEMVPMCSLISQEQGRRAATCEASGGLLGQHAMVDSSIQCLAEIRQCYRERLEHVQHSSPAAVRLSTGFLNRQNNLLEHELHPLLETLDFDQSNASSLSEVATRKAKRLTDAKYDSNKRIHATASELPISEALAPLQNDVVDRGSNSAVEGARVESNSAVDGALPEDSQVLKVVTATTVKAVSSDTSCPIEQLVQPLDRKVSKQSNRAVYASMNNEEKMLCVALVRGGSRCSKKRLEGTGNLCGTHARSFKTHGELINGIMPGHEPCLGTSLPNQGCVPSTNTLGAYVKRGSHEQDKSLTRTFPTGRVEYCAEEQVYIATKFRQSHLDLDNGSPEQVQRFSKAVHGEEAEYLAQAFILPSI